MAGDLNHEPQWAIAQPPLRADQLTPVFFYVLLWFGARRLSRIHSVPELATAADAAPHRAAAVLAAPDQAARRSGHGPAEPDT
jgi:hypothetical protein